MAKVTVRATAEEIVEEEQGSADFVTPKPGFYHLECVEAEPGYSKDKVTGEEDDSRPYIAMTYEIVAEGPEGEREPQGNYGRVWDYLTFGPKAGRNRARYQKAFYPDQFEPGRDNEIEFDTEEMVGKVLLAKLSVKKEKDRDDPTQMKERVQIRQLVPLGTVVSEEGTPDRSNAFGSDEEEAPEEEEAEDTSFEDALEPEGEEEAEDGLLSQEELEAMDAKDVAAVAKEFDIDTKELVVKFKSGAKKGKANVPATKTAVIEAILEAQGVNEEEEEEDGPF